jgi:LexA-binding, inner membrane-associated putative hydrolase
MKKRSTVPNHKDHLLGGCAAYTIIFITICCIALVIGKVPKELVTTNHSLLIYLPEMLRNLEEAIHFYSPLFIQFIEFTLGNIWPWIITALEWLLFALMGSMFPDIDIKSKSQKYLYGTFFLMLLVLIGKKDFKTVAYLSTLSFVPIFTTHRGLFHRLWFILLVTFGSWCWLSMLFPELTIAFAFYSFFFLAGAISHLWLDMGIKKMFRFHKLHINFDIFNNWRP